MSTHGNIMGFDQCLAPGNLLDSPVVPAFATCLGGLKRLVGRPSRPAAGSNHSPVLGIDLSDDNDWLQ